MIRKQLVNVFPRDQNIVSHLRAFVMNSVLVAWPFGNEMSFR